MYYSRACLTGQVVSLEYMFHKGGGYLLDDSSYRRTGFTRGYASKEVMLYMKQVLQVCAETAII